jgi:hypothetical protein
VSRIVKILIEVTLDDSSTATDTEIADAVYEGGSSFLEVTDGVVLEASGWVLQP